MATRIGRRLGLARPTAPEPFVREEAPPPVDTRFVDEAIAFAASDAPVEILPTSIPLQVEQRPFGELEGFLARGDLTLIVPASVGRANSLAASIAATLVEIDEGEDRDAEIAA